MAATKSPSKDCMCTTCGATAHSIPGKSHRRCPGAEGQTPKAKHQSVPGNQRGKWS